MSIKLKDLVKKLAAKDGQDEQVEFVVVQLSGEMVCLDVAVNANDITDLLSMFSQGDKPNDK